MQTPRNVYRPFEYPQAFSFFQQQNQAHWLPTEVPMESDIHDYRFTLTPPERNLIIQILRFFTQGDLEVNDNYNTHLIPAFPKPEVRMMLSSFAAMEGIHVWAYSYLNDTLGLPESDYSAFLHIESMKQKCDFLHTFKTDTLEDLTINMAVFGAFLEGVSLFASFAILMNFPRLGKMRGVGQIVTWSARDESLHSQGVCYLFQELIREHPEIWTEALRNRIYEICDQMITLEDAFIDTCFEMGDITGLKAADVKTYIRFIADKRLEQLSLQKRYHAPNALPWMDSMLNAKEHTNFFENRATEYAKGAVLADW